MYGGLRAFYNDYHKYLKAQGVDGVKVDAQSVINCVGKGYGGSVALARAYHKALSKSIATNFPDEVGLQRLISLSSSWFFVLQRNPY